jgi:hypothetical protein
MQYDLEDLLQHSRIAGASLAWLPLCTNADYTSKRPPRGSRLPHLRPTGELMRLPRFSETGLSLALSASHPHLLRRGLP